MEIEQELIDLGLSKAEINSRINNSVLKLNINADYNLEYGYCPKEERKFYKTIKETLDVFDEIKIPARNRVLMQEELIKKAEKYENNKEKNENMQSKMEYFFQIPFFYDILCKINLIKKDPYSLIVKISEQSKKKKTNEQKQKEIEIILESPFNWN